MRRAPVFEGRQLVQAAAQIRGAPRRRSESRISLGQTGDEGAEGECEDDEDGLELVFELEV